MMSGCCLRRSGTALVLLALACMLPAPNVDAESLDYELEPRQIAADTWVLIGKTEDFSRSNGGNIVNTAFVVTADGVVVIDSGPSRRYAEQMRRAISRITSKPVIRVFNTHHHPDHFLGNQGFADTQVAALTATISGQKEFGGAFADNLYRLSGDWMLGTEAVAASVPVSVGLSAVGGHWFEFIELSGHTEADLVILDRSTGVMFAGDLVFYNRAPTTPHADITRWLATLDRLETITFHTMLPGHGEPVNDGRAVAQTRRYLRWLASTLQTAADRGDEMTEVLALPVPPEFAAIALVRAEFARSVAHLYRGYETASMSR